MMGSEKRNGSDPVGSGAPCKPSSSPTGKRPSTSGAGNDSLTASAPSTLQGGRGDDWMTAHAAGSTFLVEAGDGADTLVPTGSGNVVAFGAGLSPADLQVSHPAGSNDLILRFPGGHSLTVAGGALGRIAEWRFAGATLSHADIMALPPVLFRDQGFGDLQSHRYAIRDAFCAANDSIERRVS